MSTIRLPHAPRRPLAIVAAVVALATLGAACSDDDPAVDGASVTTTVGDGSSVTTTIAGSDGAAPDDTSEAAPGEAATDSTVLADPEPSADDPDAPTTSLQPAKSGVPENPTLNSQGAPVELDETALLACAKNQIAWVALQRGAADEASDALAIAAQRAEASAVPEIQQFATTLDDASASASPKADVDEFLALCIARGFEY